MSEEVKKKPSYISGSERAKKNVKYQREKMTQFNLRFGNVIDADILEHLDKQPNKRQYIIRLIREDIAREQQ